MSHANLRNSDCCYFSHFHVDLKMVSCRMSNLRNDLHMSIIFVLMVIGSMSHVDFKKLPCRPAEFKG